MTTKSHGGAYLGKQSRFFKKRWFHFVLKTNKWKEWIKQWEVLFDFLVCFILLIAGRRWLASLVCFSLAMNDHEVMIWFAFAVDLLVMSNDDGDDLVWVYILVCWWLVVEDGDV